MTLEYIKSQLRYAWIPKMARGDGTSFDISLAVRTPNKNRPNPRI